MKATFTLAALVACGSMAFAQERTQTTQGSAQTTGNERTTVIGTETKAPQTIGERIAEGVANTFTNWNFEDMPPAVQKTARQQAGGAEPEIRRAANWMI